MSKQKSLRRKNHFFNQIIENRTHKLIYEKKQEVQLQWSPIFRNQGVGYESNEILHHYQHSNAQLNS